MPAGPLTVTLTAGTPVTINVTVERPAVDVLSFAKQPDPQIEITSLDGAASFAFTVDGTTPAANQAGSTQMPAVVGSTIVAYRGTGTEAPVTLVSPGTPKVQIRQVA